MKWKKILFTILSTTYWRFRLLVCPSHGEQLLWWWRHMDCHTGYRKVWSGGKIYHWCLLQTQVVQCGAFQEWTINQLINKSNNSSINHYTIKSTDQLINQSINQITNQSVITLLNQTIYWSIDQSINQSTNQKTNQSINQLINHYTIFNQPINWSNQSNKINQSINVNQTNTINQLICTFLSLRM